MEVDEAREQVRQLSREWLELSQLAQTALRRASGLQKIISGYVEMFPELEDEDDRTVRFVTARASEAEAAPQTGNAPKGAEAVRLILQDHPNVEFYVSELVEMLRERGWLPESDNPANAVRTALERLHGSSENDISKQRYTNGKVKYMYDRDRDRDRDPDPPPVSYGAGHEDEEPF
jgi:hypothetical protein